MTRTAAGIFLSVLALVVLSVWALYSALMFARRGSSLLFTQFIAIAVGLAGFGVGLLLDHRRLNRWGLVGAVYGVAVVLLGLVLIPQLAPPRNGAQRWIWGFQPSEFAKVALIFALAWYGARFKHRLHQIGYGVFGSALIVLPVLALIFLEPDRGTTLFLGTLSGLLLLVAGVKSTHLLAAAIAAVLVVGPILAADPLVRKRVGAFMNPSEHKGEAAFQNRQARLAFGEGGLLGKGPGAGTMMRTIPEAHTDFILPVIGEELGLVGSLGVVAAFVIILFCGAGVAQRAAMAGDSFGLMLASGITFLVTLQAFFNIGVVTGLFPNKGLPLPFVSRGGTNVVVMLTLTGFLLGIDRATPRIRLVTRNELVRRPRANPFQALEPQAPVRPTQNPFHP